MNVSFIVIAHQSSGTLKSCLKSIETFCKPTDELILVLNNPDGATRQISKLHADWKVLEEKNPGPAFARNAGGKIASKEFICFLDSDIGITPEWRRNIEDRFRNPWIVAGQVKIKPENNHTALSALKRYHYLIFNTRYARHRQDVFPLLDTANLIIRRDWFNTMNGFDTSLRYLEDTEFSLRLLREGADLFFDTTISVIEFTDSAETLSAYIYKQFERCKYLPKIMTIHSLDFYLPSLSTKKGVRAPSLFLILAHGLTRFFQFAGIACSPFPIYLRHIKGGRIVRNQKKSHMTGSRPTVRSFWVGNQEMRYDILLKKWD
jgi:glycosyltransferase involved in cell wall biosynthesis